MAFLWIPPDLIFDEERKIKASPDGASGLRDSLEIDQYTELVSLKWTSTAVSQVTLSLLSLFQMLLANGFQTCTLGSPGGQGWGESIRASISLLQGQPFHQVGGVSASLTWLYIPTGERGGTSPMSGTEQCNGTQCSSHLVLFL